MIPQGKSSIVREFCTLEPVVAEAAAEGKQKTFKCKVAHVDKPTANGNVYGREEFERAISQLDLSKGVLGGAIDHAGFMDAGPRLKDTCILWRELTVDPDGAVIGRFSVIEDHSCGKDFMAQLNSGLAVGFSTYSHATGRPPNDAEKKKYGGGVRMLTDVSLKSIDAVVDPAVWDARIAEARRTGENTQMPIETLEQLKTELPAVHALHEAAVKEQADRATALTATNKVLVEAINLVLPKLKGIEGIDLPRHEVLPAETAERITALQGEVKEAKAATEAARGEVATLKNKIATHDAEKADEERKAKAAEALAEALKDEKYATVREAITAAAPLAEKSFTAEGVAKFVEAKVAEYARLAQPTKVETGTKGKDVREEDLDGEGGEAVGEGTAALEAWMKGRRK